MFPLLYSKDFMQYNNHNSLTKKRIFQLFSGTKLAR